jgi:hypothetical protein
VHRSRLFAQHLPEFGWEPIVLTVHEDFYEEALDHNLTKLLPENLRVEKVKAYGVTKPRLVGDIGLRGFFQLYRKAKDLIQKEKIDFLYIPIPSFYAALLGSKLHKATGVKYGIDYIDPWVHHTKAGEKKFSRHWVSEKVADNLEKKAVKDVYLITGVAEGYYKGVQERNPHLMKSCVFEAMPYGGEKADHEKVRRMNIKPYLFEKMTDKIQLVYAGAMLPKAYEPLEAILKAISEHKELFSNLEIHFIGTGSRANDADSYTIKPLAEKYGLWQKNIFEYAKRIPYMDVIVHLEAADGIFILGSTEPHYTPSKVYQGVLSGKPIMAVLHHASTALNVVNDTKAGVCFALHPDQMDKLEQGFPAFFESYVAFMKTFDPKEVRQDEFEAYNAYSVTKKLAQALERIRA